jgi:hypothetical protein
VTKQVLCSVLRHPLNSVEHNSRYQHAVLQTAIRDVNGNALGLVASIESARALWNLGAIAAWKSEFGKLGGALTALLVSPFTQKNYPLTKWW